MTNADFNDLEWHDAKIENIFINRSNPGHTDTIEISVVWPSKKRNKVIFTDVYHANLSLGFGVVASESISEASVLDSDDELNIVKLRWSKHFERIEQLKVFRISTASTGSVIKIFAFSFILQ